MTERPSIPAIIEAGITRRLRGLHTAALGTISAHADSVCTVTLTQQLDGADVEPIADCPVVIAGDWQDGDPCLAVFTEEPFTPELAGVADNAKRHGLNAVCVPLVARPGDTTDYVALAGLVEAQFVALAEAIQDTVVVPNDGGASFKSTLLAGLASWPASVAAERLRGR